MFSTLYEGIVNTVTKLLQAVLSLLPKSPFTDFIASWSPGSQYIGWLNWFLPVGTLLTITGVWLAAVTAFYLISIVARWIKVIGD